MIPTAQRYWLKNARVPACLLDNGDFPQQTWEGLCLVDVEIADGAIAQICSAYTDTGDTPAVDLRQGQVWPCFADMHTHLDKGHIWPRSPNPDGTFDGALTTVQADRNHWHAEDVYRRMEFGLKCSYAHGTQAIRTHIDAFGEQAGISLGVFKTLQDEWKERLILQAVSLVSLDYFLTPQGVKLADKVAEVGGILGGVAYMNPDLDTQLDAVFSLAQERHLNLDFHTDETSNPNSNCLRQIAQAAIRHQFTGQIVCGHCCSLAVQTEAEVVQTIDWVKQAKIGIVSLPMCNLYLQDRQPQRTPRWRGVTLLHELKHHGIPVTVASDNCRDPFHGFGDHDMLEVFGQSVRIAHFDMPYGDWARTVTQTPAELMGLSRVGRIGVGHSADLVVFRGRNYSELLSRSQRDRIVLRKGKPIDTTLPDYAELDDLMAGRV